MTIVVFIAVVGGNLRQKGKTMIQNKNIEINDLSLWDENPRFPDKYFNLTEEDLINFFVKKENFKIKELAEAIVKDFNLPLLEKIIVLELQDQNIVIEGNRRLTAYKLLANPELTNDEKLRTFFQELSNQISINEDYELECIISSDKEEALKYVDRKHNNGNFEVGWGQAERDNFKARRGRASNKELFRIEMSKIVKSLDLPEDLKEQVLGKGYVTTFFRIIDSKPAYDLYGFSFQDGKLIIKDKNFKDKLKVIVLNVLEKKTLDGDRDINTRTLNKNPEKEEYLKSVKKEHSEKVDDIIKKNTQKDIFGEDKVNIPKVSQKIKKRKTPVTKLNDELFGRTLFLKSGKVNHLYRGIVKIYEQNSKTDNELEIVLPIIGMSLRLILDVAAREFYKVNKDEKFNENAPYKSFLKLIKKQFKENFEKEKSNYLALSTWSSSENNFEALLAKYAHGDIEFRKQDVINNSLIIADILELFFKR